MNFIIFTEFIELTFTKSRVNASQYVNACQLSRGFDNRDKLISTKSRGAACWASGMLHPLSWKTLSLAGSPKFTSVRLVQGLLFQQRVPLYHRPNPIALVKLPPLRSQWEWNTGRGSEWNRFLWERLIVALAEWKDDCSRPLCLWYTRTR